LLTVAFSRASESAVRVRSPATSSVEFRT
jgi:hypothetical protein